VSETPKRNLITMNTALAKLGCGRTRAYELINAGKIIAYKDGHNTMIDADSIGAYQASLPRIEPAEHAARQSRHAATRSRRHDADGVKH
jgi:hypothetical protein